MIILYVGLYICSYLFLKCPLISSLKFDRNFVMKRPAALKQRSASTDDGGRDSKQFFRRNPVVVHTMNASSNFTTKCRDNNSNRQPHDIKTHENV